MQREGVRPMGNPGNIENQRIHQAMQEAPAVRLGHRLRQARLARNLTQSEVAANQFSVSYISAVERGQIRPSLGALEKLAKRLQVPVAELLRLDPGDLAVAAPRPEYFSAGEREEVEVLIRESQIRMQQGEPQEALRALTSMRDRGLSPREQALVYWRVAECYRELRDGEHARTAAQDALALAERVGDPELRERIRLELGQALSLQHKHQAALDQYRACREAIEQGVIRDPVFRLSVLYLTGNEQWQLGDAEQAITDLGEAAALANELLTPERLGALYWSLSGAYRQQGDQRRARMYATRSLAAYEDAANRTLARQVITRLGRAYAQAGRVEEALPYLESARERAETQQDPRALAETQSSLAAIYLKQNRPDDAAQAARQAVEFASSVADPVVQAEAQLVLAQVLEARNDEAGAGQNFEEAIERLRAADATYALSDAYAQYSAFLERRGNNKRALEILKQAWQLRERANTL
jgi:tetratricopeptide (TPR) repeat protein